MALKFGRTAGITSRIDGDGNIRYREEEYDAYQSAVAAEAQRKADYDARKAKYKTDSDVYYGRNTVDTKKAAGAAAMINNTKTSKGENIVATAAEGETQAQIDQRYDKAISSGQKVKYDDPSIDDETRRFIKGSMLGQDPSNLAFDKGLKIRNYNEVYEGNFNPEIWMEDVKKGNFDRYGRGSHAPDKVSYYQRGTTPVDPGDYVPADLGKEIKAKDTDFYNWGDKMPTLKIKPDEGKLIIPKKEKEKEELTWEAPVLDKRKKATHTRHTRITGSFTNDKGNYVKSKTGIKDAVRIKQSDAVSPQRIKYNTEKRQSAAYYSGKTSFSGDDITGKTEEELRDFKKETRDDLKRLRKMGGMSEYVKDVRGDLATIRKATRYAKKADLGVSSATGLTMEGDKSKLRYFTPERTKLAMNGDGKMNREDGAMAGYKEYQAQEKAKTFRAQNENATNRNITWGRQQGASEGTAAQNTVTPSYGSQVREKIKTDNPTATKKEVRTLVRAKKTADQDLMNKVNLDMQAKGLIPKK
jgi:hypothetical protein